MVAVAVLVALTAVLLGGEPASAPAATRRRPRFERALLAIGMVGAAAFVVEGGPTWSAVFIESQLHAEPAISGLGPGVFGAAMAAGRFFGQATHLTDRTLLVGGALLAAAGSTITAVSPNAAVALVGLALAGAGISLNAPIVFGAAGRSRSDAAAAIATVTTIGYLGLLVGPPLVGGVAQVASLRVAFAVLAAIAVAVAAAATRVPASKRDP